MDINHKKDIYEQRGESITKENHYNHLICVMNNNKKKDPVTFNSLVNTSPGTYLL